LSSLFSSPPGNSPFLPSDAGRAATFPSANFSVSSTKEGTRLAFFGELTAHTLGPVEAPLRAALDAASGPVILDLKNLAFLDSSGALLLTLTVDARRSRKRDCRIENPTPKQKRLLQKSAAPEATEDEGNAPPPVLFRWLASLGKSVCDGILLLGQLMEFLGRFLLTTGTFLIHPSRMRWTSLVHHMEQTGLRAVPIVSLLTFLIGLVVAYMGAQQLALFGADIFAVNLLEVTVLREMAVLITAIVVAGRSSSSFTAQIGAMTANEEVDALRSMGLDPVTLLVVPRVLALVLCLPMLVFLADIMALFGGAVAIQITVDIPFHTFLTQLHAIAKMKNFLAGMIKTPFFAVAIGLVGCFQGFRATGSSESVGFLTTRSVVQSIFVVILLDALFAIFFSAIGV
jgi:phospholipid/cholesterol/gamma-HCH transport system permease protein